MTFCRPDDQEKMPVLRVVACGNGAKAQTISLIAEALSEKYVPLFATSSIEPNAKDGTDVRVLVFGEGAVNDTRRSAISDPCASPA